MRGGARLAVDVGTVRVGVAESDPAGLLATPVMTLDRDAGSGADVRALVELATQRRALEVIVGLPTGLSGREGPAARAARAYAGELAAALAQAGLRVPVRLVDERLSTLAAQRQLRVSGRRGNARDRRKVVDQVAATVFLQVALDAERATGVPPGELLPMVEPADGANE